MKKIRLESIIRGRTLPKILSYMILCTLILVSGLLYFSYIQTELRHQSYLNRFVTHLGNRIEGIQKEVANLAQNDLIINSLVDFEFQERALPVFIRSLKLSVEPVDIGFIDYKGRLVTANNAEFDLNSLTFPDWKNTVLGKGHPFFKFNHDELLIVEPIIYAKQPEAAMVVHIKSIASLVSDLPKASSDIVLVDQKNTVLFSTNRTAFPLEANLNTSDLSGLYTLKRPYLEWHVISSEKLWGSFEHLLPFFIFLLLCIFGVIFSIVSGLRISAKQASVAVKGLQQTLQHSANTSITELNSKNNAPYIDAHSSNIIEFADIQSQFSKLLADLNKTALSRNTLAGVVNSLDEILLVLNFDHEVILNNKRLEKLILDLDIVLPLDILRILPEKLLSKDCENEHMECTYLPDHFPSLSAPIELKWQRHLYRNAEGKHIGYTFSGNDITIEKSIEAELLIKNRAMDESNTSILISEAKGNAFPIIYANRAFETLTGYQKDTILGQDCKFLQGPHSEPEKIDQIREALNTQKPISLTITNYRKNGRSFQNQLTLSPIFAQNGSLTHFIGLQEDVSEREQANLLIKQAQIKAEESARLKSDFLASMSHEIRTPMNGILGMLNIVKETKLSPSQKQQINLAEQSASSLLVIINDILDFSKIEAGKLHLEPIEFDLYEETDKFIQSLISSASKKGLRIITDLSGVKSPYLIGDPSRIKQIFTNLISNAIKFTERGFIKIDMSTIEKDDERVLLSVNVRDQGIGITQESIDKIFETFSQADASTTRKYGGTGLGLSITKQLCLMMGGDISVKSELGVGSTFSFMLNLKASFKTFLPPAIYNEKETLILDSSSEEARSLQAQLNHWGHQVFTFDSLDELLAHFTTSQSYVIFIDEGTLNSLNKQNFYLTKSIFDALPPSTFMISTNEFNAYINHSLFGNPSKHQLNHLIKPITPRQLIDKAAINKTNWEIEAKDNSHQKKMFANSKILLVEDNYINQIVAQNTLKSFGAEVHLANHGLEAIKLLQAMPSFFDLILMDCQMPEMDGYEATALIRNAQAGESYTTIPIIALTANALKGDKEKCINAGMTDHVSKPIDTEDLSRALINYLNPTSHTQPKEVTKNERAYLDKSAINKPTETSEEELDAIWDEDEMLKRIGGNLPLAIKLVDVFCKDASNLFTKLEAAHAKGDRSELSSHAHSLKGIAGNVSGHRLAALFAKLEKEFIDGVEENIERYLSQALEMIEELKAVMINASKKWSV